MKAAYAFLLLGLVTFVGCSLLDDASEDSAAPDHKGGDSEIASTDNDLLPRGFVTLSQLTASERAELEERGHYLVTGPAACGFCHSDPATNPTDGPLSGGRLIRTPEGDIFATNLTAHLDSGVGRWGLDEIVHAMRDGVGRGDRKLNTSVHQGLEWLSDHDARAIAAYILSLPPVDSQFQSNEEGSGLDLGPFQIATPKILTGKGDDFRGYVPSIPSGETFQYGQYLANHVARCQNCHNGEARIFQSAEPYAGADSRNTGGGIWEEVKSVALGLKETEADVRYPSSGPDIRGTSENGLLSWQIVDIAEYLRSGRTLAGEVVDSKNCPWEFYREMNDTDRKAIATYLKGL